MFGDQMIKKRMGWPRGQLCGSCGVAKSLTAVPDATSRRSKVPLKSPKSVCQRAHFAPSASYFEINDGKTGLLSCAYNTVSLFDHAAFSVLWIAYISGGLGDMSYVCWRANPVFDPLAASSPRLKTTYMSHLILQSSIYHQTCKYLTNILTFSESFTIKSPVGGSGEPHC